jgi:dienelactone hydrolase
MRKVAIAGLFAVLALSRADAAPAPSPGPASPEESQARRQIWLIPSPVKGLMMRAVARRPPGPGPFPLAVINHDSTQNAQWRAKFPLPDDEAASAWFLARGYVVVLPQRPGHGETGGPYIEDQHGCAQADYRRAGLATADSIAAAIGFMTRQDFVRRGGVVVVGQSAGGWGALALASRNPPNVKAVINFAGGRGGRVDNRPGKICAPQRLVEAARAFGETARIPTLSVYAENDSYFPPLWSKRIADAYNRAGARGEYRLLPAFGRDGHRVFENGVAAWGPVVEEFLARLK